MDDRRSEKRYEILLKLKYFDPITKLQGETLTKNISRYGLGFPVGMKMAKGTILNLDIEGPYSEAIISSKAKVIWMGESIIGEEAEDVIYEVGVKLLKKRIY